MINNQNLKKCYSKSGFGLRKGLIRILMQITILPLFLCAEYTPLADSMDKFLGAATSSGLSRYLERYFNQVTPGNDGKWGSVETSRDSYYWTGLDKIYTFAVNRGFPYKHHTLIWGQQQPGWIESLDSDSQREEIEEWMHLVGSRYPDIALVDVVNEPFHAPPSYKNALGGDGVTGWDWVITSFELARQYMPDSAKLLINEYNVLHSNTVTFNYIALIETLKVRNLIDGIGVQGHYFEFRSDIRSSSSYIYDIATIRNNLNRLTATGLPVYISEFDIDEPIDSNQVEQYSIYFPIFWENPGVKGITFWGYIEGDVWTSHPYTFLLYADGAERPALDWIRTYINTPQRPQPPELIYPVSVEDIPRDPLLSWHSSANAGSYNLQVATGSTFLSTKMVVDTTITDTLFQMKVLGANSVYYWRVSASNESGTSEYSSTAAFVTGTTITDIDLVENQAAHYSLSQNCPNPFNPATTIEYSIAREGLIRLEIYDLMGHRVKTLVDRKVPAGRHTILFKADDLNSGIYFYKISAGEFKQIRKMIYIK